VTTRKTTDSDVTGEPPRSGASQVYGGMVGELIAGAPRESSYVPAEPMDLRIVRRRMPRSVDELDPDEREQLTALLFPESLDKALDPTVDDCPLNIEVAAVVDETGALRFRLYGWDFGAGYLMSPSGLDVIAMGCQHDLEHWHVDQRPIFWAMDRAYLRADHGFEQALKFCWWDDKCWDEVTGKPRGTVGSEPYVREQLAAFSAKA
jgi:hypothetical protein